MGNKKASVVVTDGDQAMCCAIREVLPDAAHRLYIWHIQKNASHELKNQQFNHDFANLMTSPIEVDVFEELWRSLIKKYNFQNNLWIQRLHADRKMWAEAYLKGIFFGGIRTTSRCEGMHSFLNAFVNNKLNMFEFVTQFHRAINKLRYNEQKEDHLSSYNSPVCKHALKAYEKHAAGIYTCVAFMKFQQELNKESTYLVTNEVIQDGDEHIY